MMLPSVRVRVAQMSTLSASWLVSYHGLILAASIDRRFMWTLNKTQASAKSRVVRTCDSANALI